MARRGHKGSKTDLRIVDSWETPPEVIEPLKKRFGFKYDMAADHLNHVVDDYFTEQDDSLSIDWPDTWKWCNPPYSNPLPWVEKAAKHRACVMLTNYDSTSRWAKLVFSEANLVMLLDWRVKFINADTGERGKSNMYRQMISVWLPEKPKNKAIIQHVSMRELWEACGYRNDELFNFLSRSKKK